MWIIALDRLWNGVPFDAQGGSVTLEAGYGRLEWFGIAAALPPPAIARIDLPADRAAQIAAQIATAKGFTPNGGAQTELRIVQPTDFWTSPRFPVRYTQQAPYTRLAWVVRLPVGWRDNPTRYVAEVRVDSISGEAVGGDVGATVGKGSAPLPVFGGHIGTILRAAWRLEVRAVGHSGGETTVHTYASAWRTLAATADGPRFYGALSGVRSVSEASRRKPFVKTHTVRVTDASRHTATLDYDATQGLLRDAKGQLALAGSALRAWISPVRLSATTTD